MKKIISIILSMVLMTLVLTSCNTKEDPHTFDDMHSEPSYTTTETTTEETTTTVYEEVVEDYDYLTYYWTDSASYVISDLESQGYQILNDYGDLYILSSEYAGAKILDWYYNLRIWISGDTVTGVEIIIAYDRPNSMGPEERLQYTVPVFDNAYNLLEELYGPCERYYASTDEMTIEDFNYQYHKGEYTRGFTFGYVWYKSDHTAVGVYSEGDQVVIIKYLQCEPEPVLPDTTYNNDSIL
jgi:hypothetical protein